MKFQIYRSFLLVIISLAFGQNLIAGQTSGFNGRIYGQTEPNIGSYNTTNSIDLNFLSQSQADSIEFGISNIEISQLESTAEISESSHSKSILIAGTSANLILEAINQESTNEDAQNAISEEYINLQITLDGELITQLSVTAVTDSYIELSGITDTGIVVKLIIENEVLN